MQLSLFTSFILALSTTAVSALPAAAPEAVPEAVPKAVPEAVSSELNPDDTTIVSRNGVLVILYEHSRYRNAFLNKIFLNKECHNIREDYAGKLSSLKVHYGCCKFYDDWDCNGSSFEVCDWRKEYMDDGWNDSVWSLNCYPDPRA